MPCQSNRVRADVQDARNVVARMRQGARLFDDKIENLERGLATGRVTSIEKLRRVRAQLDAELEKPVESWAMASPAWAEREPELHVELREVVKSEILPAVVRMRDFLRDRLAPAARGDVEGLCALPDGDGAYRVMRAALKSARLEPSQVDYVNAHGTSTPQGDSLETLAIKRCFGDHAYKLAVSSTKSMTGHLLGAAGALEAAVTILAMRDQIAPPTINLDNPEDTGLDLAPNQARRLPIARAMTNSFGFGGTNASLIFGRPDTPQPA